MIEDLLQPLVSQRFLNEQRYREGHIRIINALPGKRILGVHVPQMKALAKELARRDDALEMIAGFEREAAAEKTASAGGTGCRGRLCYEETVVWGLMINYVKLPLDERLELVRKFVPYIDNWAVCDLFDGAAKWMAREKRLNAGVLWDMLCGYFGSDKEFEVRFAVVMSMSYFLDEEWLPLVFGRLDSLDFGRISSEYVSARQMKAMSGRGKACGEGGAGNASAEVNLSREGSAKGVVLGEPPYYVRMAVAWLLATTLAKFPDRTRAYMKVSVLPDDVRRLYARKARESFRTRDVSPF